jgi:putative GTP pyrophosphokinase
MSESTPLRDSYASEVSRYESYGLQIEQLILDLLAASNIEVMSTVHRVKTLASTLDKSDRLEGSIDRVGDVHDILGVRVITYFSDHVDKVADLIESEFTPDLKLTRDRRSAIDADRFGYLSVHYVVTLGSSRLALPEWANFADLRFEIQIRSVLQHAWAEIEHDLGYKSTAGSIPVTFRRRFSRLAGLLEIADQEFISLRADLANYEESVGEAVTAGLNAQLDQVSLHAYIRTNSRLRRIDDKINAGHGSVLIDSSTDYARGRADELLALGIENLEDVDRLLSERGDLIADIAIAWLNDDETVDEDMSSGHYETLSRGISLFYLYLILRSEDHVFKPRGAGPGFIKNADAFRDLVERKTKS